MWLQERDFYNGSEARDFCTEAESYHTDKKENQIFLIFKEIQNEAVAKSYMRKVFLIYEEMRKYLTIYEEAQFRIIDWMTQDQTLSGTE
jgi:hypothetical protein